jgi:hypothetical protein
MGQNTSGITRHELLTRGVRLLAGLSVVATVGHSRGAHAAKAAKEDFSYQDSPKDGKSCSSCRLFTPASASKGTCAVVEGVVSADGWCRAYSPRG